MLNNCDNVKQLWRAHLCCYNLFKMYLIYKSHPTQIGVSLGCLVTEWNIQLFVICFCCTYVVCTVCCCTVCTVCCCTVCTVCCCMYCLYCMLLCGVFHGKEILKQTRFTRLKVILKAVFYIRHRLSYAIIQADFVVQTVDYFKNIWYVLLRLNVPNSCFQQKICAIT